MKIENKENIVCPWCEFINPFDYTEFDLSEYQCENCEKIFYVEIIQQPPLFTTNTQKLCQRCYKNYIEGEKNYCKECRTELTNMTGMKY